MSEIKKYADKLLFTPGPLTTSYTVKGAALRDLGSRDSVFIRQIAEIRNKLVRLAHAEIPEYEAVIMQGSGTFGIESVISSAIPAGGALLNIVNGAYGRRISQIARIHSIPLVELVCDEDQIPEMEKIEEIITQNPAITHLALVHGETTTGLINPIESTGEIAGRHNIAFIVDAMSTFGAYEIDVNASGISYLISSSNKCIEGIPGFSFIVARRSELEKCKNQSRTLSLNLYEQWKGLNTDGQFRFTPPVQAILAFSEALTELEEEGGVPARAQRYSENNKVLTEEMQKLGFRLYLPEQLRGYIITSFLYPGNNFNFSEFYSRLNEKGFVIYPGKLSKTDCFRIGNIGQLYPEDIRKLTEAIDVVIRDMNLIIS